MVSVAVSKLGCSGLVFVGLGAKINGSYCRDELLLRRLLLAIRSIAERVQHTWPHYEMLTKLCQGYNMQLLYVTLKTVIHC